MAEEKDFINETKTWLETINYSMHSCSSDYKKCWFTSNTPGNDNPTIECWITEHGEKRMRISECSSFKFFLCLISGEMQYKHPDTKKYINMFVHYAKLAKAYPPF